MKEYKGAIATIVVIVLVIGASLLGRWVINREGIKTDDIKGLNVSREVFIKGCVRGASSDPEVFTEAQKQDYCSCCYDTGTARWGGKEFTDKNLKLDETGILTPEMNDLVNECVLKVL